MLRLIALSEFQSFNNNISTLLLENKHYHIITNRPRDDIIALLITESKTREFVMNIELKLNIKLANKNKVLIKGKLY